MIQDTVSATAVKICRALLGDARKVDCDIIESHIREMLANQDGAAPAMEGDQHVYCGVTGTESLRQQVDQALPKHENIAKSNLYWPDKP